MRRLRRAKIVATLGPASSSAEMIARLFDAGVDVFRINMSHTSQERMRELIAIIRAAEQATGRPIGVLVDLQGPKLRLGTFLGGQATSTRATRSCSIPIPRRAMQPASTCRIRKSSWRSSPATRC